MADQTPTAFFVICADMIPTHIIKYRFQYHLIFRRSYHTIPIGNDAVTPAGVKTGYRIPFFVRANRELCLITVTPPVRHTNDRFHNTVDVRRRKSADSD